MNQRYKHLEKCVKTRAAGRLPQGILYIGKYVTMCILGRKAWNYHRAISIRVPKFSKKKAISSVLGVEWSKFDYWLLVRCPNHFQWCRVRSQDFERFYTLIAIQIERMRVRERSHVKINSSAIVPREYHTLPLILRLSQFVRRERKRLDFHFPKPRGKKRDRSDVLKKKSMMISSDAYFKTFVCRMIKRKSKFIDWFSKAALANVRIHFMADD